VTGDDVTLTTTSYVVLGLVARIEPTTSYELKQFVARSIGYFWPFPHSQLYAEPARLASAGYLTEEAEATGRKRRLYRSTPEGMAALRAWITAGTSDQSEIRDLGLLKLFFGGRVDRTALVDLAEHQRAAHTTRLAEYEDLARLVAPVAEPFELKTLDLGLRYERLAVSFWDEVRADLG
jgi:DNA-binding PadR family transcriptional regulator